MVVILAGKLLRRAHRSTRVTIIIRNLKKHKFAQGYAGEMPPRRVDEKRGVEVGWNKKLGGRARLCKIGDGALWRTWMTVYMGDRVLVN